MSKESMLLKLPVDLFLEKLIDRCRKCLESELKYEKSHYIFYHLSEYELQKNSFKEPQDFKQLYQNLVRDMIALYTKTNNSSLLPIFDFLLGDQTLKNDLSEINPDELNLPDYVEQNSMITEEIDEGTDSNIFLGICNNKRVVYKIFNEKKKPEEEVLINEININILIKEKNCNQIVKFIGHIQNPLFLPIIVMEYMSSNLFDCIINDDIHFPEDELLTIISDLVKAIDFLHNQMKMIHRDIKPDNVLIDDQGHAKLGDFGLAVKMKNDEEQFIKKVGTPGYIAPEILENKPYGKKVDIFSFGITLWEIVHRSSLQSSIGKANDMAYMIYVMNGGRATIKETICPMYASLIKQCWHQDPKQRPTSKDIDEELRKPHSNSKKRKCFQI